ncbi:MAG: glycosyltransferase family 2 protein [Bacteroidetes bacterium]|nr:glycosyltransferase family 2 protein [Bacteroidota bacterium]
MDTPQQDIVDLSVIIIAGHEEHNIGPCLDSVRWAHEIIVVCSQQDDATMRIASQYTEHVVYRAFSGFAEQKQFALGLATRDWVLSLDADERVTPELKNDIRRVVREDGPADGYSMPRKNHFDGKWLRHGGWYPDRQLRLLRRSNARVTHRLVHEGFEIEGRRDELPSPLLHFTLPRVGHMLRKNLSYSLYEAREKAARRRITVIDFLFRPPLEFLKKYLVQRGFLDGWEGFIVAVIHSSNKLHVLLHLWEMQYRGNRETGS